MTRIKISLTILLVMVGISIFSGIWTNKKCGELQAKAKALSVEFQQGDIESARKIACELSNIWEGTRKKAAVLLKYDRLFEIDRIVSHICLLIDHDEEEVLPQIDELIHMLDILHENEIPYLSSVL